MVPEDGAYYAKLELLPAYGDHLYGLTDATASWSQAESVAQSWGGHLAAINEGSGQSWLQGMFGAYGNLWIGLNDQAVEGAWVWSTGEAATYTNWASGLPDNYDSYYGSNSDVVSIQGDGTWADWNVSRSSYRGLMERDESGVGGPGSTGSYAQYLLDVDVNDPVPPRVTAVSGLPAEGGSTGAVVDAFTVTVSEDLLASTVNAANPLVGRYGGHYYLLTPTVATWAAAEAYAQSLGGHLVTINDPAEQAWAAAWVRTWGRHSPWIGLTDQTTEGTWVWSSGQAVS